MEELGKTGFVIDGWQVLPAEGTLTRAGEVVHLEPKVMDVLVYLASRQGEVVTRDELEQGVWKGAIVGYDAITKTVIKVRKALQDDAKTPRCVVTIPKKGYQLIARVNALDETSEPPAFTLTSKVGKRAAMGVLGLLIAVTIIGINWFNTNPTSLPEANKTPSVLIVPFDNLEKDNKHDAFVDGMTEDLITDLSRLSSLFVYASNTSFQYKSKSIDPQQLNRELGVDYVLKGNVRRVRDTLRINVQLVDARTGFNVWAERYDRNLNEVFALQNELTNHFIKSLTLKLTTQQQQQLEKRSTANLEAYDLFMEGQRAQKQRTRETHILAKDFYRKAIELDPSYGRAYGSLAVTMVMEYRRDWSEAPAETLDRALGLAEQAVLLDSNIPQTHWALGFVHLMRKEYVQAERAAAKTIEISPNYADGYGLQAFINNHLGNAQLALQQINRGIELNPFYSWDYPMNRGWAYYMLGNSEQAIKNLEQAQARNENVAHIKMLLAASYVQAGRQDDAEWVVEALKVLNPSISLSHTSMILAIASTKYKQMLLDDLKKAGLEEN